MHCGEIQRQDENYLDPLASIHYREIGPSILIFFDVLEYLCIFLLIEVDA